jgi:hypothetical protein
MTLTYTIGVTLTPLEVLKTKKQEMKTSFPYQFLAAWMSVVCYVLPLYIFNEPRLLPKWYLCLIGLAGTFAHVTSNKTASTSGRAFILGRSWELVKEHPVILVSFIGSPSIPAE